LPESFAVSHDPENRITGNAKRMPAIRGLPHEAGGVAVWRRDVERRDVERRDVERRDVERRDVERSAT
jgi:hypothetical protein